MRGVGESTGCFGWRIVEMIDNVSMGKEQFLALRAAFCSSEKENTSK